MKNSLDGSEKRWRVGPWHAMDPPASLEANSKK
jgi:hypothetical protein